MSRSSQNEGLHNPAKRFFEWNGEKGIFRYYDKEKAENIEVSLPFTFLVLDQLTTIKGWDDASQSGVYSNEVKNTKEEELNVRSFKGGNVSFKGLYGDIKDKLKAAGYNYVKSLYIAFYDNKVLTIGNIQLKGAALNEWIEFCKGYKSLVMSKAICVSGNELMKKGRTEYYVPKFELKDVTTDTDMAAQNLDRELQEYLKQYTTAKVQSPDTVTLPSGRTVGLVDAPDNGLVDDLPF